MTDNCYRSRKLGPILGPTHGLSHLAPDREQVRLLGQEFPQGLRRLAADAFDVVGDLVARLELRTAGSQVPPKIGQVLKSRMVKSGAGDVLDPLVIGDLPVLDRLSEYFRKS